MAMVTQNLNIREVFTWYEGVYEMVFLPASMLMGKNLYTLGRRVQIRVGVTHTNLPMGKIYRINTTITI